MNKKVLVKTDQNNSAHDNSAQHKTKQDNTKHFKSSFVPIGKYHKTGQDKTEQNRTKQNITSIFEGFISLGS